MEDDEQLPQTPTKELPVSWGDFWDWLGIYYTHGEHGVIFWNQGDSEGLIKIVNCDVTDDDGQNEMMTDFLLEQSLREPQLNGLVRIDSILKTELVEGFRNQLRVKTEQGGEGWNDINSRILDLECGDEIGIWLMERVPYIGLTHPNMGKKEMMRKVARAATDISTATGWLLHDLRPPNYGFRKDGSAVIFDFKLTSASVLTLADHPYEKSALMKKHMEDMKHSLYGQYYGLIRNNSNTKV